VCSDCRVPADAGEPGAETLLEELVTQTLREGSVSAISQDDRYFLIVARGHRDLLAQIQGLVGGMGWVRVIEDRRREHNLLPREGHEGPPFTA
jgi:hypothetical protein